MKKILISILFLFYFLPGFSQGWIYINGTVTDSLTGNPIPDHQVTIMSDSTYGFVYYNVVYTDSVGYYFDDVPVMSDSTGIIYVMTLDCNDFPHQATLVFNPVNNSFTQDFQICTSNVICQAFFTYEQITGLAFLFTDQSTGEIDSWVWDFGDGNYAFVQNPLKIFTFSGWYTVSLTISNQGTGCYDFYSMEIYVADSTAECHAGFSCRPYPIGSSNSFEFTVLSIGIIQSWTWNFGDGTGSTEQNPYHSFPGPGTYNTCLTINGYNCSDTYCLEIVISDTVYQQLYGQVFEGNFPLQQGVVEIFTLNPDGSFTPLNDGCPVDSNGIYFFTLVPQGTYLLLAIPYDTTGYLPTYYGNVTNWQSAVRIEIGVPINPYIINLVMVPAGTEYYGSRIAYRSN